MGGQGGGWEGSYLLTFPSLMGKLCSGSSGCSGKKMGSPLSLPRGAAGGPQNITTELRDAHLPLTSVMSPKGSMSRSRFREQEWITFRYLPSRGAEGTGRGTRLYPALTKRVGFGVWAG